MKRIFLILSLITICNISYADIASVGYVDSVVATKQDKLPNAPGNNGKYKLVYNSNTGQIGWEFEQFSLTCSSGTYDIGFSQCIDPNVVANGYTSDNTKHTWVVTFDYGIVKGISSCNNSTSAHLAQATDVEFSQTNTGQYCWCKMTEPVSSVWVSGYDHGSMYDCSIACASHCGSFVQSVYEVRSAMFGSVGN